MATTFVLLRLLHRLTVRSSAFVALLLWTITLFAAVSVSGAANVGDQVDLRATHQAGIPFHKVPGGGQTFRRVPGGTVGTVTDLARDGRWL